MLYIPRVSLYVLFYVLYSKKIYFDLDNCYHFYQVEVTIRSVIFIYLTL
jgi:hypothetical protein